LIIKKSVGVCKSIYFHPGPGIEIPTQSTQVLASKDSQTDLLAKNAAAVPVPCIVHPSTLIAHRTVNEYGIVF
jgi:hypothetical protein